MKNMRAVLIIAAILFGGFIGWYFFMDTLTLSQITGKSDNPLASVFVDMIDFDTGLTRYDLYNLSRKNDYWQRRMGEVAAIQDPENRNTENEKLFAEIMEDPSIKKIIQKIGGFGTDAILSILENMK